MEYEILAGMDLYDRKSGLFIGQVVEQITTGKNPSWRVERIRPGARSTYVIPLDQDYIWKYFSPQPVEGGLFGT